MEDFKTWAIRKVLEESSKGGYTPIRMDLDGAISFDIVAKRDNEIMAIKIIYNIDTLKPEIANDLKRISIRLEMQVLVIGSRSGTGILEDGVMYFRYQIPIMNMWTFREYIEGKKPVTYSGPGGYYVHIDGKKMQELRTSKGKSIGYLSGKIGISRRSISLYETGNSTTLDVYRKLSELMEEDLSTSLDIMEICKQWVKEPENDDEYLTGFMGQVRETLKGIGLLTEFFSKSPFDAISEEKKESLFVMDINQGENYIERRISTLKNLCNILERDPVVISIENTFRDSIGGVSIFSLSELKSIENSESIRRKIESVKESGY